MVALAPHDSETSTWDVLNTFPKLHSRAREVKTHICTEASHSKSLGCVEIWLVIYESYAGLESFTRDPISYTQSVYSLYAAMFAVKAAMDPGGIDLVMPWHPNAQWWWPFTGTPSVGNPYAPPLTPPVVAPITIPAWAFPFLACAASAVVGVTADAIWRWINGEPIALDARAVTAAITDCVWGSCAAVLVAAIAASPTVIGTCLIVGIGAPTCWLAGEVVCELYDRFQGGGGGKPTYCVLF